MVMKLKTLGMALMAALSIVAITPMNAAALLVSAENFEGGASGWSVNSTTNGGPAFSEFLGAFPGTGGAQAVSKIFPLSGAQTVVGIQFDFYEIDSWDNELFNIFIDDALVMSHPFDFTVYDASPDMANILPPPPILADLGFGQWPDQTYTHNFIIYPTTATGFKLGFGATLDGENGDNEAWGIDNLVIIDDVQGPGPVIPEPSTMMLLGSGLMGAFLRKRRLS